MADSCRISSKPDSHPNMNPLFLVGQHLERIAIRNRDGCCLKHIRYADTRQQHRKSEPMH